MQAECMSLYDLTDGIITKFVTHSIFGYFSVIALILKWKNSSFSTTNTSQNIKVISSIDLLIQIISNSSYSVSSSALESWRDW
jgi:hypothetical protein